jgi:adenylate cyclase
MSWHLGSRFERFIWAHLTFTFNALVLGAAALVWLVASHWSNALAWPLAALTAIAIHAFLHNANPLTPRALARNDQLLFEVCNLGGGSIRSFYRWVPSDPRCRLCLVPFGGIGKLAGIRPSRKNPEFCTDCIESAPVGVYEREVGILFADIRGFTSSAEQRRSGEVAEALTRFYAIVSRILTQDDALVEIVGDQVMALYLPDFPSLRERTAEVMLAAARRLLEEIERRRGEGVMQVGIGLHIGIASVGNVAKGKIKDFTAVGDVVNTAARLQSAAQAGHIVISDEIYERAPRSCGNAERVSLSLKGKSEPVRARVL